MILEISLLIYQQRNIHPADVCVPAGGTLEYYPVAICFVRARVAGRSGGKSAPAMSAYRSGEEIIDERTGKKHDYTKKKGIDYSEILSPILATAANEWMTNRSQLWNKVEASEKRVDAQLTRELIIAIPRELDRPNQIALVREYIQSNYVDCGMIADINLHHLSGDNPHAHVMLTMRELKIDENGRVEFGNKDRSWNDKKLLAAQVKEWEVLTNQYLERAGLEIRIDSRSYEEQGIERIPQIHLGKEAASMRAKGIPTERGDEYDRIDLANAEIRARLEIIYQAESAIRDLVRDEEHQRAEAKKAVDLKYQQEQQRREREKLRQPVQPKIPDLFRKLPQLTGEHKPKFDDYQVKLFREDGTIPVYKNDELIATYREIDNQWVIDSGDTDLQIIADMESNLYKYGRVRHITANLERDYISKTSKLNRDDPRMLAALAEVIENTIKSGADPFQNTCLTSKDIEYIAAATQGVRPGRIRQEPIVTTPESKVIPLTPEPIPVTPDLEVIPLAPELVSPSEITEKIREEKRFGGLGDILKKVRDLPSEAFVAINNVVDQRIEARRQEEAARQEVIAQRQAEAARQVEMANQRQIEKAAQRAKAAQLVKQIELDKQRAVETARNEWLDNLTSTVTCINLGDLVVKVAEHNNGNSFTAGQYKILLDRNNLNRFQVYKNDIRVLVLSKEQFQWTTELIDLNLKLIPTEEDFQVDIKKAGIRVDLWIDYRDRVEEEVKTSISRTGTLNSWISLDRDLKSDIERVIDEHIKTEDLYGYSTYSKVKFDGKEFRAIRELMTVHNDKLNRVESNNLEKYTKNKLALQQIRLMTSRDKNPSMGELRKVIADSRKYKKPDNPEVLRAGHDLNELCPESIKVNGKAPDDYLHDRVFIEKKALELTQQVKPVIRRDPPTRKRERNQGMSR